MILMTIQRLLAEMLEIDPEEITPETDLEEDLDMDSLDGTELLLALEEEFDLEIDEDTARGFRTVGDIIDYVSEKTED